MTSKCLEDLKILIKNLTKMSLMKIQICVLECQLTIQNTQAVVVWEEKNEMDIVSLQIFSKWSFCMESTAKAMNVYYDYVRQCSSYASSLDMGEKQLLINR